MKRKMLLGIMFCLVLVSSGHAETVYLKDGNVMKGNIISQDDRYIVMDDKGFPRRFYRSQIDRIEEDAPEEKKRVYDGEVRSEKAALILEFMRLTGMSKTLESTFNQAFSQFPAEQQEMVKKVISIDDILDQAVPVFHAYFSEEELQELIAFYKTPVGMKYSELLPDIQFEIVKKLMLYMKKQIRF